MPFKHKNIEYGLPHEEYPKENVDQYMEELKKRNWSGKRTGCNHFSI